MVSHKVSSLLSKRLIYDLHLGHLPATSYIRYSWGRGGRGGRFLREDTQVIMKRPPRAATDDDISPPPYDAAAIKAPRLVNPETPYNARGHDRPLQSLALVSRQSEPRHAVGQRPQPKTAVL